MKRKTTLAVAACIALFSLGVIGFVSLIVGGVSFATSGAASSADNFLQQLRNDQVELARNEMSIQFSNSITDEELRDYATENGIDQYQSSNWTITTIDDENGKLSGQIATKSGDQIPLDVFLVLEQGAWKVDRLERAMSDGESDNRLLGGNTQLNDGFDPQTALSTNDSRERKRTGAVTRNNAPMRNAKASEMAPHEPFNSPIPVEFLETKNLSILDIPDEDKALGIVQDWTSRFSQGGKDGDFSAFHQQTTKEFKTNFPLEQFDRVVEKFTNEQIDFELLESVTPEFSQPPSLAADGTLRLVGSFPSETPVGFEYSFQNQANDWRLHDFNLTVSSGGGKLILPDIATLKRLTVEQTERFAKSVSIGDFSAFHEATAEPFREQIPIRRFSTIFKSFIKENVHLGWINGESPVFDMTPTINSKGVVTLRGHFPVEPKVNFDYGLVQEQTTWKIVAVNISVDSAKDEN